MFRFALLSFLLVAAQANIRSEFESKLRSKVALRDLRALQGLPEGFDAFEFNFAGFTFNAAMAMEKCPNEWDATFQCLIKDCPNALDVCPDLTGAAPVGSITTIAPGDMESGEMEGMDVNATEPEMPEMEPPSEMPEPETMPEGEGEMPVEGEGETPMEEMPMEATPVPEAEDIVDGVEDVIDAIDELLETAVPSSGGSRFLQDAAAIPECAELEAEFCDALAGEDTEDCCLTACTDEIQALLVCVIMEETGEDRSDCEIPECETAGPAPSTSAPAPAPSSDAASISRVAALSASLLAFAVL
ncbi:expressed unknown protein [Seminavis robusta]|uniref:Uncharacterized protein n=1 Tax=Seminavis robusta TaxID=568900 RepID=A0A9N8EFU8_9STRA|nr:expressed unknown protein [Seminavis robusta]|eukprot:Sro1061_g236850.1 n/a (302) ;mRNA; r:23697-24697